MSQRFLIIVEVAPPGLDALLQHADLAAARVPYGRGQDIAEPVVVADLRMLIVGCVVAGLGGEFAGVGNERAII